jgi:hypothetical protein
MAILNAEALASVARRSPVALLCLAMVLYLAGCFLVDALVQEERPLAFSHRLHVEETGFDCTDCHGGAADAEDPGMPSPAQCALCHSDLDAEKPEHLRVETLVVDGELRAAHAGRQSDEILFSHAAHASRAPDCAACHADVAQDDGALADLAPGLRTSMEECLACHATSGGPALEDCGACHAEIRAGEAPPSHRASWMRFHGTVVRGFPGERIDQCTLCHQPSECTTCHQIEPPAGHNNFFRRRGHGLTASMDRDSCATCHDSDSCARCHDEVRPQSHTGSFGAPTDRHCLACHEPLRSQSCGVCHEGTPSHELATPLPPDHLPGMDCRMCHGNGQPLPHVDNGQSCVTCHN